MNESPSQPQEKEEPIRVTIPRLGKRQITVEYHDIASEVVPANSTPASVASPVDFSDSTDGSYSSELNDGKHKPAHVSSTAKEQAPVSEIPLLKGKYTYENDHCCWKGRWGNSINGKHIGPTSEFYYTSKQSKSTFPVSGIYRGYFWMKYVPPKKITESGMHVQFTEKDGKYIVSGSGTNRFGQYDLSGTFDPSTQEMSCTRVYHINRPRHPDSTQPKEIRSTRNSSLFKDNIKIPPSVPPALHLCYRLHMKMQSNKFAQPFMHPVDPVALHIPDYFDIIKNPMDFGTIYQRLISGKISTEAEYVRLMELVFDNALTYNKPQDDVAFMAQELQTYFDKEYTQMKRQASLMEDDGYIITRGRSFKRLNSTESISGSQPMRLYSLRNTSSIGLMDKRPRIELPVDVEPFQWCIVEAVVKYTKQNSEKMY